MANGENIIILSEKEFLVLQILDTADAMYGLDICNKSGNKIAKHDLEDILANLIRYGYVTSRIGKHVTEEIPLKMWSITDKGREKLYE